MAPTETPRDRAAAFLARSGDFRLGDLLTEASHPRSAALSAVARADAAAGLEILFDVDRDVVAAFAAWACSGQPEQIAAAALEALRRGGRLFFTGCGATGRLAILLEAAWRAFWQARGEAAWEDRARAVMAGGDFALVKSVEGFEDVPAFGRRQLAEQGVSAGDVVFALTEGGETPFVIGTAWAGLDAGARVFFVYGNPDPLLRAHVPRSREVLDEPRIERVNLTTGPMAVAGSTRMQATSVQLLAMMTVLELVLRDRIGSPAPSLPVALAGAFAELHASLAAPARCASLARLVEAEEHAYRTGARTSYLAGALAVDVLTDTTERSPTFGTPPFRAWDDTRSAESWTFLFTPDPTTEEAWSHLLRRAPRALAWSPADLTPLGALPRLGLAELRSFRIGLDGLLHRPFRPGDGLTAVAAPADGARFTPLLDRARAEGAYAALIAVGPPAFCDALRPDVALPVPAAPLFLDPLTRLGAKLLLNALSTCVMTRLGRVLGNRMIWVVPSNLKLLDRATRIVRDLASVSYEDACLALFEALDYLEPRRREGRAVPAPVGLAVLHLRRGVPFAEAEARLGELLGELLAEPA